ncbi:hypothetical protein B0H19DRAFT_676648 [Mycena capillaripes]|nr:hypothetical protein B0H19DRAFT_676648 [Mycena capillaripes]
MAVQRLGIFRSFSLALFSIGHPSTGKGMNGGSIDSTDRSLMIILLWKARFLVCSFTLVHTSPSIWLNTYSPSGTAWSNHGDSVELRSAIEFH